MRAHSFPLIGTVVARLAALRAPVRALIFLYWIQDLAGGLINAFIQIFLFERFTHLELNILATVVYYTGIMLGFFVPGLLASVYRLNIKHGFWISFLTMGLAILYLLTISTTAGAYLGMLLWGVGQGLFWLTVNTFELTETQDDERDFYASVLSAGGQILNLVGPACAALLIWLSGSLLHIGTFTLLFTIAPAIFLLGLLSFSVIRDYRPPRISWADVRHYFADRTNQAAQVYTAGMGFQQMLGVTVPPLAILFVLGTALNVSVYNTFFAVFASICILTVARFRTPSNRLLIFGITTAGLVIGITVFGFSLTLLGLAVYTILDGIFSPLLGVSSHVIDLSSMEIGRKETDFYATMLIRDVFLWFWRSVSGLLFLAVLLLVGTGAPALSNGLYMMAAGLIATYLGAVLFTRIRRRHI